jgi:hypothetical protein
MALLFTILNLWSAPAPAPAEGGVPISISTYQHPPSGTSCRSCHGGVSGAEKKLAFPYPRLGR